MAANDGGLARFQQRMRAIPKAVREAVQPALVKSGEDLSGTMQRLAPVDTGALKGSIAVTAPGQSTPAYSQPGGSRVAGENEVLVTAGNSDVRYPHLVEYGTSDTAAQPFFWPAFRLNKKRLANRIKRAVSKAVKDNWGSK
ncbi:HK97 gp10 family phage protein [Rhizobiaceae bacterium n13]|uniref:HK97-gp10 family putative phage morphogenesis protein n=1 Tax=Ferirhizobium litorale TaxID=2927786 RepID=UPI0024B2A354|nr:HK97-gp10 family putative phage morphogenesis protein [Fererhizobium litorale]MDI7864090.1 HK97 gp10 family phage protein [Fererhizobium litorale]